MSNRNTQLVQNVQRLESVVFPCFGKPYDDELPQTATENDIVVGLMHQHTGHSIDTLEAQLNHQIIE